MNGMLSEADVGIMHSIYLLCSDGVSLFITPPLGALEVIVQNGLATTSLTRTFEAWIGVAQVHL